MKKKFLLTPGPTPVPEEVLLTQAAPIIHHRTKEASEIIMSATEDLKKVFKTKNDVLTLTSSGTGGMEGAIANTLKEGDKVIAIACGKFGERWVEISRAYRLNVVVIDREWGDYPDPEDIKKELDKNPDAKAVLSTLCETSTATLGCIKEIGELLKDRDTLHIVDAISGLGGDNIEVDNWHVDICVAGSQKGLMLPPGLAFVTMSEKAWRFTEQSNLPKYYFDFKAYKKSLGKSTTPYTPAITLIIGLRKALDLILKEGIDNVLHRNAVMAEATRKAVKALGLELLSKKPANTVTAIKAPQGVDGAEWKNLLAKKYGMNVAGGQAQLKGKIIRIAHLGYIDPFDILAVISAIEMSLKELGYPVKIGEGIKSAEEVLSTL